MDNKNKEINIITEAQPLSTSVSQGRDMHFCGEKPTQTISHCGDEISSSITLPGNDTFEDDVFFSKLQTLWDEQNKNIDQLLTEANDNVAISKRKHPATPYRVQVLVQYAILSIVSLASTIYWTILIPSLAYTTPALVTCLTIETIYILLLSECLCWTISLLIYDPARVSVLRMSRFIRRSRMHPHYAPEPTHRQHRPSNSVTIDFYQKTVEHYQISTRRVRQVSAACIAAVVALTVVSCTKSGDGHTITQDHPGRIASVENVSEITSKI